MKPLLLATTNKGKILEFRDLLAPHFDCVPSDSRAPEVVEDGTTYHQNAEKKARAFFSIYQIPVLSDDSGLEIDALGGAPGLYSARFGGEAISWPERWNFMYSKLKGIKESLWTARFRSVLCYFDGQKAIFFEGTVEGRILPAPLGQKGFGYDPVFYSSELKKGFGEATTDEKAFVSHRARAAKLFLDWAMKNVP